MHIIHTWQELAAYLDSPSAPDLKALVRTRRDQLMEYGDLSELGIFVIIQPGDTMTAIEEAVGWPVLIDGVPTWEWVQRHGTIFEMPFVLSDSGAGHVLIVPDTEGVDPTLLELCRAYADKPNGDLAEGAKAVKPRLSGRPLEAQAQRNQRSVLRGAFFMPERNLAMLSLYDPDTMKAALLLPLDPTLHRLLSDRIRDAIACGLEGLTHIIVVEPSDGEGDFIREAAFSPFWNPLFETRYGDPAHIPPWDWGEGLDGWGWEFIRTIGNDGFAFIVLVPDSEGIDPMLRAMCANYISPAM